MVLYGTRPEAIKVAPLVLALQSHPAIEPLVAVTGQHREMLDQVNDLFGITPRHDLDLMVPGATLAELSSRTLAATNRLIRAERPDAVVVQGDTSTAFAACLAAFYEQVPVVHLEAGLRTGNLYSPFPEEANRVLTGRIARLHLAPTAQSKANLLLERVPEVDIAVTGNTVIDALDLAVAMPVKFTDDRLATLIERSERFVLVTAHRRESWGAPMREAMTAIRDVAQNHPGLRWVVPMHRNPVVREVIDQELGGLSSVLLTEPLTYHEFSHAMSAAHFLVTDSGGVQEEAPRLGKPVLVMRETTERPEAVDAGTVKLVGTNRMILRTSLTELLDDTAVYDRMASAVNPYGDGRAAQRSVAALEELFGLGRRLLDFVPEPQGVARV
jgi:UDP-N-acetylglucosamine 2-epimerase (non-hydrolysing)